jgi:hypothetical protein
MSGRFIGYAPQQIDLSIFQSLFTASGANSISASININASKSVSRKVETQVFLALVIKDSFVIVSQEQSTPADKSAS